MVFLLGTRQLRSCIAERRRRAFPPAVSGFSGYLLPSHPVSPNLKPQCGWQWG